MSELHKVTDIQVQVKRNNRYSVFLDDEFAFGLDQDVLIKSGIARGDELSDEQINNILELEEKKKAKDKAFRLLAVRARSKKELYDRLHQAKFSEKIIEWVVLELQRLQLLNDSEFAILFARNRMVTKPVGQFLLKQELKAKGLSEEDIQKGVRAAYLEIPEAKVARQVAVKAKRKYRNLEEVKARQKTNNFLLRRGFSWDIVNDIMDNWELLTDSE